MKKVVVTILLILPFLLIYFISFTGKILSTYTHIYVERIAIVDSRGDEFENNSTIKIDKGETYSLNVKVFPELASNKILLMSNSNDKICSVDENYIATGLEYGTCKIIFTSVDRHYVQFVINLEVSHSEIRDISLNKTTVDLTRGKSEQIIATVEPSTTAQEYRNLIWSSDNENVAVVTNNGKITGVNIGNATITVKSEHNPSISKTIVVNVSEGFGIGLFFDYTGTSIYEVNTSEFDLKTITIINLDNTTFDDIWYQIDTIYDENKIDASNLANGIIKFNTEKTVITISVHTEIDDVEFKDSIKIWFVEN